MSPRGRPAPGDSGWEKTGDPDVWRARKNGLTLTVSHLATGGWVAEIEGPGITPRRSPLLATRAAAQTWAEVNARDLP